MPQCKFKSLKRSYDLDKVYYDNSFQRRVVWSRENLNAYLQAATRGWTQSSSVTLADVEKCLEYAKEVGCSYSVKYFSDLKEGGYKFVSIDGQNRTKMVIRFMNNQEPISGDNFVDADGNNVPKIVNKHFKQLPARLQDKLKDCNMIFNVHDDVTREDCASIFRNINSTEPPNAQNLRQSITTPIAGWIRDLSKKYSELTSTLFKEKDLNAMKDDELLAKTAMVLTNKYNDEFYNKQVENVGLNLSKTDIDRWYKLGEGFYDLSDPNCPYSQDSLFNRTDRILSMVSMLVRNRDKEKHPDLKTGLYWALVIVCEWAHDNDYIISDHTKFFSEINKLDLRLFEESNIHYLNERKKHLKAASDPSSIRKNDYYFDWPRLAHQALSRSKRKAKILSAIVAETSKYSVKRVMIEKVQEAV